VLRRSSAEGTVETREDAWQSSVEFQNAFDELMQATPGEYPLRRLAIGVDNLDRIYPQFCQPGILVTNQAWC